MTMRIGKLMTACSILAAITLQKPLMAAGTILHTCSSFTDYSRGKLVDLSLSQDGRLTLSPQIIHTLASGDHYIWCAASDSRGNVYLGTGNDGKVYRLSPRGDSTLIFDAEEPQIFALAVDRQDRIYIASSPDGCITQIDAAGRKRIFHEPGQTYIWAMACDAQGDLWVATGAKGQLLRIKPDGSATIALSCEAEHVRSVLLTPEAVYAGTSRPGLVYRLPRNGPPYVLLDAEAEEVHSLAMDREGVLYAAALATASPAAGAIMQILASQQVRPQDEDAEAGDEESDVPAEIRQDESFSATATRSKLLRIDADGFARNLWPTENGEVQTLFYDKKGNLYAGAGDNGRLFRINQEGDLSLIMQVDATHISAITTTTDGALALATSNMGRCYLLGAAAEKGHFESEPLDAEALSTWGTLSWKGQGEVSFYTRSGNTQKPEATWSSWQKVTDEAGIFRIPSPAARFLQWRCELKASDQSPEVRAVTVSYIQKNRVPEIRQIEVYPQGLAFDLSDGALGSTPGITEAGALPKVEKRPGYCSVSWDFMDPNKDALCFAVFYRGISQVHWRLLCKELSQRAFSWDAAQMADGEYQLKIVASDSLLLPLGMGLRSEKVSPAFTIDNTGPVIKNITTQSVDAKMHLSFSICDALTPLRETWVSINAGGWQPVYPIDGLCDNLCERFMLPIPVYDQDMEFAIKTIDRNGNYRVMHSAAKGH